MIDFVPGGVTAPCGLKAAGVRCGIKKRGKDLALIFSEVPANAVGMYTTNRVQAAPLLVTRQNLKNQRAQAVVINSGNANSCTGEQGLKDAQGMTELVAVGLGIKSEDVVVASTGIIGELLPMDAITKGIKKAIRQLSSEGGHEAAIAIMTTDKTPKEIAVKTVISGKKVTIGGIAKGAGMISPHLATMLAFISTDAAISPVYLRKALVKSVENSFNSITVDGAMSTNDMVVILANGLARNDEIKARGENFQKFQLALNEVTKRLARAIVRDGEGATKFVEIHIRGALNYEDARKVAFSVANSNLVKTAIFSQDLNWGRIISAAGAAGADIEPQKLDIFIGDLKVVKGGLSTNYPVEQAKEILANPEIVITVDLNLGEEATVVWTCDLSYDYVRINARYHT